MDHQDWQTVVFRKSDSKETKKTHTAPKPVDFDPENITKPRLAGNELGRAIQKARSEKKNPSTGRAYTQSDLDKACNLPKNTVRDYENGTAKYNPDYVNRMAKVLDVVLPRPAKK